MKNAGQQIRQKSFHTPPNWVTILGMTTRRTTHTILVHKGVLEYVSTNIESFHDDRNIMSGRKPSSLFSMVVKKKSLMENIFIIYFFFALEVIFTVFSEQKNYL